MNILEALKSGKRFKRKHHPSDSWFDYDTMVQAIRDDPHFDYADSFFLCEDWEVEPDTITITWNQLHTAVNTCPYGEFLNSEGNKLRTTSVWNKLKKEISNELSTSIE